MTKEEFKAKYGSDALSDLNKVVLDNDSDRRLLEAKILQWYSGLHVMEKRDFAVFFGIEVHREGSVKFNPNYRP